MRYAIEEKNLFATVTQPYSKALDAPITGGGQNVAFNLVHTWSPVLSQSLGWDILGFLEIRTGSPARARQSRSHHFLSLRSCLSRTSCFHQGTVLMEVPKISISSFRRPLGLTGITP